MTFNYLQICNDLLKELNPKTREITLRRFGLDKNKERETLEAVGKSYGITRERVRQIVEAGFLKIKPKLDKHKTIFERFQAELKKSGGLKKEDILLTGFGGDKLQNHIYFLLSVADPFVRFHEGKNYHSLWALSSDNFSRAQNVVENIYKKLNQEKKPLLLKNLQSSFANLNPATLLSYLEISKKILQNQEGFYGLKSWPEINPRGVRDKALLVLRKENKPLHFSDISKLIQGSLMQTVHNELIKDPKFVLVGRGMYALAEWGYYPGEVKDVISQTLKDAKKPLSRQEVLDKVLKQRMVQENTVFLNLNNKKYFLKNLQGKYWVKEA